ncbi:VanW family protein [Clostridium sp. AN503]|uniref:VanW family protein n=1 Tax=Clostridium sp. AN503 TaxID=3160598 RepID=UPI00345A24D7
MNQYENQRGSGTGRSRAKGSSHSRNTSARSRSGRSGASGGGRSSYTRNSSSSGRRSSGNRGGGSDFDYMKLAVGGVILIIAIVCIVFLVKGMTGKSGETETETTTEAETELLKEVTVDGINITGMSREDAKQAILKDFAWGMKVTWQDQSYDVADLMAGKVDSLLQEIYAGEPKESYSLDTSGLEDAAAAEAASVAAQWDKKAKNGSISSYDAENDKFLFTGAENGQAVDQEKLKNDILAALGRKDFDAVIEASVNAVEPEFSESTAREKYKTLSSFTTNTTSNSKRNTNVKLSAQAINGIVLQPGEEFSFNDRVGERTEAKGYKGAAAYNNGEVVEEIGGGVCQVSTTLYNAVVRAGLKTTVRRSHTYEPSYVTPGMDATVSWGGPDYKFVNNSSAAVGIRASYSNQTVTISIYGIPVLEEGVKYDLKSKKLKDMDPPAPAYEEDPTLEPGIEKTKSSGSRGSYWETRLVITKNGEVVSQEVDHNVTYKGHAPVILRNTSGTVAATEPSESILESGVIDPSGESSTLDGDPVQTGPGGGPGVSVGPGGSSGGQSGQNQNGSVNGPGGGAVTNPVPSTTPSPTTTPTPSQAPSPTTAPNQAPSPTPGGGSAPTAGTDGPTIAPMPGA